MAQPLYELLTGPEGDSLNWTERQKQSCEELRVGTYIGTHFGLKLDLPAIYSFCN